MDDADALAEGRSRIEVMEKTPVFVEVGHGASLL
jgi:hypothetical protein